MIKSNQSIFDYNLQQGEAFFIPAVSEQITKASIARERALALSSSDNKLLKLPRVQVIHEGIVIAELEQIVPLEQISITQFEN